ncbi:hypothetical protein A1D22_01450 [Pasteurellaceae bacterium LFhippo2]|nr:hypothetical protein [Pasteurellaceae bacterium LFhippo2]
MLELSRRSLLLGLGGMAALAVSPAIANTSGFTVRSATLEPRPLKRQLKHYFAFDTGIYHGLKMNNMRLKMGKVKKDDRSPLFIEGLYENPPKAWEPRVDNGYPNVILDDKGVYHCYYTLFVVDPSSTATPREKRSEIAYSTKDRKVGLAYARSTDGIHWEKPNLNVVDFEGSKENNLIMRDVAGTGVLYEPNESDPNKRFKLITRKEDNLKMAVAFSADGVHFSELIEWKENSPVLGADCHNSVFRDSRTNQYILNTRLWASNFRVQAISRSDDFINWSPMEEVLRGQGFDEQVYSMTVFEHNDIYFGLASVYKQGDISVMDFDTLNLELYWSTNLTEWNKAVPENNIFIPSGAGRDKYLEGEFDSATIFASSMTAGDNRIYYTGGKGRHRGWRETGLGLAYADKNRLVGMVQRYPEKPMSFGTQAFKFFGEDLFIWADLDQGGSLSIEVEKKAGFEPENCELDRQENGAYKVTFKGQSLVETTKEKPVPFKVTLNKGTFWGISGNFEMDESRYWKG